MELKVAKKILDAAVEGGFYDGDLPTKKNEIIEQGEYYLEEAKRASETLGLEDDPVVVQILELGGEEVETKEKKEKAKKTTKSTTSTKSTTARKSRNAKDQEKAEAKHEDLDEEARDKAEQEPDPEDEGPENPGYKSGFPPRSSGGISEGDEREIDNYPAEEEGKTYGNLPVPPDIEGDTRPLPADLSALSDKDLRRHHSENNAYLARVIYMLGREQNELANAKHLFDAAYRKALKDVDRLDPDTEKAKLKEVIDQEVREDEEVQEWDERVTVHETHVTDLKALKEIYSSNVSVCSREWTMRQDEWEKSNTK